MKRAPRKRGVRPLIAAVFGLSLLRVGLASEPDNFTNRPATAAEWADPSALNAINLKTNSLLDEVAAQLTDCGLERLNLSLKSALGGGEIGALEDWADRELSVKKTVVPLDQSIYAEAGILPRWGTSLVFGTRSFGITADGIVPSVMLAGHYVGVDKLGHFFDQGYAYYEHIILLKGDEASLIESMGLEDEDGTNGIIGTGVRSYGDMAANFQGYLFWRSVAAGPRPYFACENGKYVRTSRKFDWSDYVSDAWDEAINCSEFTDVLRPAVERSKGYLKCPVEPRKCQAILEQTCGFSYLSPACLPYVKAAAIPDAACAHMIQEDQEGRVCNAYEPGFWRRSKARIFVVDNGAGLGTLFKHGIDRAGEYLKGLETAYPSCVPSVNCLPFGRIPSTAP